MSAEIYLIVNSVGCGVTVSSFSNTAIYVASSLAVGTKFASVDTWFPSVSIHLTNLFPVVAVAVEPLIVPPVIATVSDSGLTVPFVVSVETYLIVNSVGSGSGVTLVFASNTAMYVASFLSVGVNCAFVDFVFPSVSIHLTNLFPSLGVAVEPVIVPPVIATVSLAGSTVP